MHYMNSKQPAGIIQYDSMNTIPRQTHENTPLAKKKRHYATLLHWQRLYSDSVMPPLFGGLVQSKGSYSYLFYSSGNNGTIPLVGTKRSRFILYSISINTQWKG
uniref:Uncharacterized protein n=1 Tax=Cyphia bulbosa var. bulbosa TaxID=2041115 RepID=A0A291F3E3_9ASTR|nr:hypothetical protein Cyp_bu_bu1Pt0742 [Cyphia bulbosa var. bulbosa]